MLKISWKDKVSNTDVLKRITEKYCDRNSLLIEGLMKRIHAFEQVIKEGQESLANAKVSA